MNQLIGNFEHNQRERERLRQHYITQLRSQVMDNITRKKKEDHQKKIADQLFQKRVERQRQQLRKKYIIKRNNLNKSTQQRIHSQSLINPEIWNEYSSMSAKGLAQSPFERFSSSLNKNHSFSEYAQEKPKLCLHLNINYLKAKQSLQQQKQKMIRFRTQVNYSSKKRINRGVASALENLKSITHKIKTQIQSLPFLEQYRKSKNSKQQQTNYKQWIEIQPRGKSFI